MSDAAPPTADPEDDPIRDSRHLRGITGLDLFSEALHGHVIGSFCAAGNEERAFTDDELGVMHEPVTETMEIIERHADTSWRRAP